VRNRGALLFCSVDCSVARKLLLCGPIGRFPALLENLFPRKKRFSGKSPGLEKAFGRFGAFWKILFPFSSETAPQISIKREQISIKSSKTPVQEGKLACTALFSGLQGVQISEKAYKTPK
jgi:hypothetical protein